ncbi:hypothetical protein FRC01_007854 [Tulasnella sp. 417]|nr:hypothetical protein FRC01_007854 [Tulasnella sp. 417]
MSRPKRSKSLPTSLRRFFYDRSAELGWPLSVISRSDRSHYLLPPQDPPTRNGQAANILAPKEPILAAYTVGQIQNLVELILSFASERLLLNCLWVCKAYNHIANKYLWKELSNADLLLELLGPIIDIGEASTPSTSWDFSAPPTSSQWESFDKRARYVKSITSWAWGYQSTTDRYRPSDEPSDDQTSCSCLDECPMSRDALATLELRQKDVRHPGSPAGTRSPLLPNLERLTFMFGNLYGPSTSILPFIGPKLVTLTLLYQVCIEGITSGRLNAFISESLHALALFFSTHGPLPSLQRLKIGMEEFSMFSIIAGYDVIERATEYDPIDEPVLGLLDWCPYLQYLELPTFSRHERLLAYLRKLPQLIFLTASFQGSEGMMLFAEGLAASNPSLRKLRLGHYGRSPTPAEVLQPLLELRHLEELSIKSHLGYILSPDRLPWNLSPIFLQRLSGAWPNLESLTLYPSSGITIQTLESFQDSSLFFHLTHLELHIYNLGLEPPTLREVSTAVRLIRPLHSLKTLAMETPGFIGSTPSERLAMATYAERIGSKKARISLKEEFARRRYDSLQN